MTMPRQKDSWRRSKLRSSNLPARETSDDVCHLPQLIESVYDARRLHSAAELPQPSSMRGSTCLLNRQFWSLQLSTRRGALHGTDQNVARWGLPDSIRNVTLIKQWYVAQSSRKEAKVFTYQIKMITNLDFPVKIGENILNIEYSFLYTCEEPLSFGHSPGLTNVGFRLFDDKREEVICEGRAIEEGTRVPPDQWIPAVASIPQAAIDVNKTYLLVVDFVQEGSHWLRDEQEHEQRSYVNFYRDQNQSDVSANVFIDSALHPPRTREVLKRSAPLPKRSISRAGSYDTLITGISTEGGLKLVDNELSLIEDNRMTKATNVKSSNAVFGLVFRFSPDLFDLDPQSFRVNCYRTLLNRSPEDSVLANPIEFESNKDRILFWMSILDSSEFKAASLPIGWDSSHKIAESMGWPSGASFLESCLQLESSLAINYEVFLTRLFSSVHQNSYSLSDIGRAIDANQMNAWATGIFEGLVNMAIEYSVATSLVDSHKKRIDALEANLHDSDITIRVLKKTVDELISWKETMIKPDQIPPFVAVTETDLESTRSESRAKSRKQRE